jgi:hypothetical protein
LIILLVKEGLQFLVLNLQSVHLLREEHDAVVLFSVIFESDEGALRTSENYCGARILMPEEILVGNHFLATPRLVTTPKSQLTQQVPSHPIHFIELAFVSAEGT